LSISFHAVIPVVNNVQLLPASLNGHDFIGQEQPGDINLAGQENGETGGACYDRFG
jgi:hypothetical protein